MFDTTTEGRDRIAFAEPDVDFAISAFELDYGRFTRGMSNDARFMLYLPYSRLDSGNSDQTPRLFDRWTDSHIRTAFGWYPLASVPHGSLAARDASTGAPIGVNWTEFDPLSTPDGRYVIHDSDYGSLYVRDTLIGLGLQMPTPRPVVGYPYTLAARLVDSYGRVRPKRTVVFEREHNGAWERIGAISTDASGYARMTFPKSTSTVRYRARVARVWPYSGALSTVTVSPHASVGAPTGPDSLQASVPATYTAMLYPRHATGTRALVIRCYHLENGRWVYRQSVWATASGSSRFSRCSASVALPSTGSWSLRAYHPADGVLVESESAYGLNVQVR